MPQVFLSLHNTTPIYRNNKKREEKLLFLREISTVWKLAVMCASFLVYEIKIQHAYGVFFPSLFPASQSQFPEVFKLSNAQFSYGTWQGWWGRENVSLCILHSDRWIIRLLLQNFTNAACWPNMIKKRQVLLPGSPKKQWNRVQNHWR